MEKRKVGTMMQGLPSCEDVSEARREQCEYYASRMNELRGSDYRRRREALSWEDKVARLIPIVGNAYLTDDLEMLRDKQGKTREYAIDLGQAM